MTVFPCWGMNITQLRCGIASLLALFWWRWGICMRVLSPSELPSNTASPGITGARGGSRYAARWGLRRSRGVVFYTYLRGCMHWYLWFGSSTAAWPWTCRRWRCSLLSPFCCWSTWFSSSSWAPAEGSSAWLTHICDCCSSWKHPRLFVSVILLFTAADMVKYVTLTFPSACARVCVCVLRRHLSVQLYYIRRFAYHDLNAYVCVVRMMIYERHLKTGELIFMAKSLNA